MISLLHTRDFKLIRNQNRLEFHVHKTGAQLPLTTVLVKDTLKWCTFFAGSHSLYLRNFLKKKTIKIAFYPDIPRPWYLLFNVVKASNTYFEKDYRNADVIFHFEDVTKSDHLIPTDAKARCFLNFKCQDISKSHVTKTFEQVFGYPLSLDPEKHQGFAVEKSEKNGAHDGQIIQCPTPPKPGYVYQHIIDNTETKQQIVTDYRCSTLKGKITLVFIKQRPIENRFSNSNIHASIISPEQVFSISEIQKIQEFIKAIQVDWGGLDILRDQKTGRLYIVDVNTTDMGPPLALSLIDQWKVTKQLAKSLEYYLLNTI